MSQENEKLKEVENSYVQLQETIQSYENTISQLQSDLSSKDECRLKQDQTILDLQDTIHSLSVTI